MIATSLSPAGEYNMWEKRTLWEFATRVPFFIHVPWLPQSHGQRTSALVELVDVYPSLLDLAGVAGPPADTHPLEGVSFKAAIEDPGSSVTGKGFALSTYPRCPTPGGPIWMDACIHTVERTEFGFMGYTLRVDKWRYTEFIKWNGSALAPLWDQVRITP